MTRLTYTMKMILGWICWNIWWRCSDWIQDSPRLNNLLLPWVGFYAYGCGYDYYREMRK